VGKKRLYQLLAAENLPSLPVVATKVLALSNDAVSLLVGYSEIILRDVTLSTQVIK
jgi:HD-like signal output (HDOD) protein